MPDSPSPLSLSDTDLQAWLGRRTQVSDTVTPQLAERLAATVESARPPRHARGEELPQGWYSVLFPHVVPASRLGRDGHPALGDFLPPVPLPKRMFAGKRIRFAEPIRIGDELERVSEIVSITPKEGRSGPLVFVTLRHTIAGPRGVAVTEEQDVVYRSADSGAGKRPAGPDSFPAQRQSALIRADEVMLFRYSALCFNGHRIHYDQPYATQVEGYPGLVVNGGLSALHAFEHLHEAWGGPLESLSTRNVSPLHVGTPFRVLSTAGDEDRQVDFRVVAAETGATVLEGSAVLAGQA